MKLTCFIEYKIDPYKLAEFKIYAASWGKIIPSCGGDLIGYFLPHEGTNNTAFGLINFESLADYEKYRARLKKDENGKINFEYAQKEKFILEEKRSFLTTELGTYLQKAKGII